MHDDGHENDGAERSAPSVPGREPETGYTVSGPVPRARLSRGTRAGLWGLRIFVIILAGMVVYTFIANLANS
ncbi:hypothetical protein KIH31_15705 [Paenarthrobacter sp. DKR-5]|uniref:hypothetical protein n=1 Tax=Paenarthrobacter sp. DKR-5 TaxID=2835535 RepID=UPI001BDBD9B5|nr:hypothetical protein [Paenarthrobacter sp. DKR-5]MBT1004032.1 hypothetical protein [Paenarthrobacter sp. DKR-5]